MWRLEQGAFARLDIPLEYVQQESLRPALYLESGEPIKALLLDNEDRVIFEKELVEGVNNNGTDIWSDICSDN